VRAAVALLLAAPVLAAAGWESVVAPPSLRFPRDHGSHPAFRTEWWYAAGQLREAGGRRLGFQLTFFRQGLAPGPAEAGASALRARQLLAAHLAVGELGGKEMRFAQRVRRLEGGLAAVSSDDLDVVLDDWSVRRTSDGTIHVAASDRDAAIALRLELVPTKPLVLQGEGGLVRKGPEPGNASVYLSWTRLAVRGTTELDGRLAAVEGEAWFDHEWGSSQLGPDVEGWDWFGLRLADGRELMLYHLRHADGSSAADSAGTLVAPDGSPRHLASSDFTTHVRTWWTSPRTHASYPAIVHVTVPTAGLDLETHPLVPDSELDARSSTGTVYWEGPVAVAGSASGEGYVELTGAAVSMAGKF
jgi:predicted secreted hydrolase